MREIQSAKDKFDLEIDRIAMQGAALNFLILSLNCLFVYNRCSYEGNCVTYLLNILYIFSFSASLSTDLSSKELSS